MQLKDFSLGDRYTLTHGGLFLSGIQALVRLTLEQAMHDKARGLSTAGYVSGYRGSPLAGLDTEFLANQALIDAHQVKFHAAVNEELAATAISGAQQVGLHPGAKVEGVFGMWYGKAPGLDRACDALRHGNQAGTAPNGGVLVVVGDDHHAKSSSIASCSETAFCDLDMPVLVPASVADVIDFGLYGWALSRYSGLWVGLIALADTMDSAMTTIRPETPPDFSMPENGFDVHIRQHDRFLPKDFRISEQKMPALQAFVDAHPIDRIFGQARKAHTGIIASGRAYTLLRETLARLGFMQEPDLDAAGLRLLKIGMAWPLDTETLSRFARGLKRILVLEEGRPFIEHSVRSALYGKSKASVSAKFDESGVRQLPEAGELSNAAVFDVVSGFLGKASTHSEESVPSSMASKGRRPLFCAGCPHNRSTRVPEGSRMLAGIGCHAMAIWLDRDADHYCQMGGEGAMWLGQAPFTEEKHIFANIGDGTYFHSGILAVRAAVAAGVNITYNFLYNHAVAMTGGQPVDGEMTVKSIVQGLEAEGVGKIIVVSNDPKRTREQGYAGPVRHRDRLPETQIELRETPGCTVLLYDQSCAAELRRKRRRGLAETPSARTFINREVCEGCGDCSVQSSCVAVEPVETELGTKRHIHQSACNIDLSCVRGFCPSFVMVEGAELRKEAQGEDIDLDKLISETPLPTLKDTSGADFECNVALAGIGGGGTSTASAILGVAGHIDGLMVKTFDMTGLAQKGGAVTAQVRLTRRTFSESSPQIPEGGAHVLIGVDLITAASLAMLKLTRLGRTHAFINTSIENTVEFVLTGEVPGSGRRHQSALDAACASLRRVAATKLCARLLGDSQMTNMLMLGFAWQSGEIPVSHAALRRAIELNGVRVEDNIAAFEYGRVAYLDGQKLIPELNEVEAEKTYDEHMDFLRNRLTAYQDKAYARRHQGLVDRVRSATSHLKASEREALMRAVADSYAKLLAYKDEFEVARLYVEADFMRSLKSEFSSFDKLKVLMAPPFLPGTDPSTGRPKKRAFGPWIFPLFRVLAKMKWLRKTPLNPFAGSAERRMERELIAEYETTVDTLCAGVQADRVELALAIARLPGKVRGFGPVKEASVAEYRAERASLLRRYLEGADDAAATAVIHREAA